MAVGAIIAILILAVVILGKKQQATDTVDDLGGDVDSNASAPVQKIAVAIATAEGFYVSGARPQRNHNPGDMTSDLIGKGIGFDGAFVIYANDEDGWNNLYAQINAWFKGTSRYHSQNSTIADLAGLNDETGYTTTDQNSWADTVARTLGVSIDTPIGEING